MPSAGLVQHLLPPADLWPRLLPRVLRSGSLLLVVDDINLDINIVHFLLIQKASQVGDHARSLLNHQHRQRTGKLVPTVGMVISICCIHIAHPNMLPSARTVYAGALASGSFAFAVRRELADHSPHIIPDLGDLFDPHERLWEAR